MESQDYPQEYDKSPKQKYIIIILAVLILITISLILYFNFIKGKDNNKPSASSKETVILKVEKEKIYQTDLDAEIAAYPGIITDEIKKRLLDKLADDSKILQKAQKERAIILDQTVYDSVSKDYAKRIEMVNKAKEYFDQQGERITGTVIAIWFYNGGLVSLKYEDAKELAYGKITRIHEDVKNKKITIQEAAGQIINDSSLAQIDVAYKANAKFQFDNKKGQPITFDPKFDEILRSLSEGEVSNIYLAQDNLIDKEGETDAVYMFGRIEKKILK